MSRAWTQFQPLKGGTRPGNRDAARGTARRPRRDTRAETTPPHKPETDIRERTEHENNKNPAGAKHLKSVVLTFRPANPVRLGDRRSCKRTLHFSCYPVFAGQLGFEGGQLRLDVIRGRSGSRRGLTGQGSR